MDGFDIQYLPQLLLDEIFKNLGVQDLLNCMLVCQHWYNLLESGRSRPWRAALIHELPKRSADFYKSRQVDNPKDTLRLFFHGWNHQECTHNLKIRPDGLTVYFREIRQTTTDIVRSKIGYDHGVQVWEITYEQPQCNDVTYFYIVHQFALYVYIYMCTVFVHRLC